jgi:hypothetical protein
LWKNPISRYSTENIKLPLFVISIPGKARIIPK